MKNYCDRFRGGLPPILKALVPQVPELAEYVLHHDQRWINSMREWNGGPIHTFKIENQTYKLSGAIDDLLVRVDDGALAILDGKSKAKRPEPGEGAKYYGTQMDTYDLIFSKIGFPTAKKAFLWYVTPVSFTDGDLAVPSATMTFDNHVQVLEANGDRAMAKIEAIHKILMLHPDRTKPPAPGGACEFCNFAGRS